MRKMIKYILRYIYYSPTTIPDVTKLIKKISLRRQSPPPWQYYPTWPDNYAEVDTMCQATSPNLIFYLLLCFSFTTSSDKYLEHKPFPLYFTTINKPIFFYLSLLQTSLSDLTKNYLYHQFFHLHRDPKLATNNVILSQLFNYDKETETRLINMNFE